MTIALMRHFEAAERAATEIEQATATLKGLRLFNEVEDLLSDLAALAALCRRSVRRWQEQIHSGNESYSPADGQAWRLVYRRMHDTFTRVAQLVPPLESLGYALPGKANFLFAWRSVKSLFAFDFDSLLNPPRR